jgi:WhiB family redox-sensing transcriptional regulator
MTWQDQAACRNEHPELFFPVGTTGPARRQIAKAKSVCHRCPVTGTCLAWALDTGQRFGVWGGLSEDERQELQRCSGPNLSPGSPDLDLRSSGASDRARTSSMAPAGCVRATRSA